LHFTIAGLLAACTEHVEKDCRDVPGSGFEAHGTLTGIDPEDQSRMPIEEDSLERYGDRLYVRLGYVTLDLREPSDPGKSTLGALDAHVCVIMLSGERPCTPVDGDVNVTDHTPTSFDIDLTVSSDLASGQARLLHREWTELSCTDGPS
jgi:hypothetical protein